MDRLEDMEKRVAVVGGGYAGMAAAWTLSESCIPVTVFEASKTLGGRARGIDYRGVRLDNGQHILLGCYRETLSLIQKACRAENPCFRMPLELRIGDFHMRAFPLPPPFDLFFGLLFSKGLSPSAKLGAIRFLIKTKSMKFGEDMSVSHLLDLHGQKQEAINHLWAPLCIAALNTPIEKASAQVFLAVLEDGLNGPDSDLVIPNVDLSTLFPEGAAEFVRQSGGTVLTSSPVRSVVRHGGHFVVQTDHGAQDFTHVVLAVAPQHLEKLARTMPEMDIPEFHYQPIVTVYSLYEKNVGLPQKMTGFPHGIAQWLFDRGNGLISAVISSEGIHSALSPDALGQAIHAAICSIIPALQPPLWQKVIHEKRATFSCEVGIRRPAQETVVPNLYLAGDYTAGRYPATLEGAVLNGIACAELIASA